MANALRTQDKCFGVRGPHEVIRWPLTAGQTGIKAGNFVITDASVTAAIAAGNNAPCGATSGKTNRLLLRALEDSVDENGTIKSYISGILVKPGVYFEMPIYHATQASAVADPANQLLTSYELYNVGGVFAIDISETTDVKMQIVDYNPEDLPTWPGAITAGTVLNPRVWVEFLPAHCWTAIAS